MSQQIQQNACVFGGVGGLGSAIATYLREQGCQTWCTSRQSSDDPFTLQVTTSMADGLESLSSLSNLDIIVWSQGVNTNDSALNVNAQTYQHVMSINVDFVVQTLQYLWAIGKINQGARLCIISSIWQEISQICGD
jgi:3-oxoacyl-[acyl-carrier protein] reductase